MNEDTCNACVKRLEKDNRIDPKIHVLWKDDAKYRVLSDPHHLHVDYKLRREKITEKIGQVSNDDLEKHLNVLLIYYKLLNYDIKESRKSCFCIKRAKLTIQILLMQ